MSGNLISLKRWHWLLIAALVGLAAGYIARPTALDLRSAYGEARNGQKEFETAMVREAEGRRRFKDLVAHRQIVPDPTGGERDVWIISGIYCSNAPEVSDGKLHWKPTFFLAADPYRPVSNLPQLLGESSAPAIARFEKIPGPTVLDFLQLLNETRAVQFRHAWWRSYAVTTWLAGSILLIGILWPTAIDLIFFGRLIRPREAKAANLPPSPTVAKPAKVEMSQEDRAKLAALDAAMEASLKAGATTGKVAAAVAAPATVRPLTGVADGPAPVEVKKARAFGAGAEDYYPTEQKAKSASPKAGP